MTGRKRNWPGARPICKTIRRRGYRGKRSNGGFGSGMEAKLIMALEAEHDIDQAYLWYENRRKGLGEDFLERVDACIQAIRRTPEMHAKVYENYRRGFVRRFPYVVLYEYTDDTVVVYGVLHTALDPKKWRE